MENFKNNKNGENTPRNKDNKFRNNKFKNNRNNGEGDRNEATPKRPKPEKKKHVMLNLKIAYQDFYADILDNLYDFLDSIPFEKLSVPVKIDRPDRPLPSYCGEIVRFNSDNTITIRVSTETAYYISDKHVICIKALKNYKNNEISRITEFIITNKLPSINDNFADIEKAFTESELNEETEVEENS